MARAVRLVVGLCVWLLQCSPGLTADLKESVQPLIESHAGQVAVAIKHLDTGVSFVWRDAEPMPTASLIKFPIMIEAYRQAEAAGLDLTQLVSLRDEDKVPGSGILASHFSAGTSFSTRDAIRLMIAFSDNTATNLVIDRIGLAATARSMEDLGYPQTKLHSKVFRRDTSIFPERSRTFGLGSTTAAEMIGLLERLHKRTLVSEKASDAMREHLLACDDKLKFPRLLPRGTKIAHKTGSVDSARTDAGIIETPKGPFAICVLSAENKDTRWADDNAGDVLCAKVALAAYDFFQEVRANDPAADCDHPLADELRSQHLSSEVILPSPSMGEGAGGRGEKYDFRASLRRLDADAAEEASDANRPGLGGDDEEDETQDAAALPARQPRDALSGLPFVSCRNWVVADARSGALVGESSSGAVVDIASTTKIMTAYLVLKLAEGDPGLMEEKVTISERAGKTSGSSCGVKTGEKIELRDLLYGLMVRSGNDAAVALAEHVGKRFEPASRKSSGDALSRFIAEMNRTAKRLEMSGTKFTNPNGLPEKGHASCARDLVRLTVAARKLPPFREIVATRQFTADVFARDGSKRPQTWKSTNKLLAIEGYTGVKTGWTRAAGSCLVSSGERGRDELIVVILGAPSAAAAVADSRNLYRWAWRERGAKE